jgi:hypothetical protein
LINVPTKVDFERARKARARVFLKVAQASSRRWRDEATMPLFTLSIILDAEGTLAADARHVLPPRTMTE